MEYSSESGELVMEVVSVSGETSMGIIAAVTCGTFIAEVSKGGGVDLEMNGN